MAVHHLCPSTLELGALALVVAQVTLQACLLAFALLIPERGRSVMAARCLLMPTSGLPVSFRALSFRAFAHRSSMRHSSGNYHPIFTVRR